MWRAYGRTTSRVALVFTVPLTSGAAVPLNILFSPVAYFNDQRVTDEMHTVIKNVSAYKDFLRSLERQRILAMVFIMLISAVVCLKHEGFREEREWRVIYSVKRNHIQIGRNFN